MLSGRPRRLRRAIEAEALNFSRSVHGVQFSLMEETAVATADAALWAPDHLTMIVSDLHFEKGSAFASRGQFLPPYDTRATLYRLEALMKALKPRCVVALGDSFHDQAGPERLGMQDRAQLARLVSATDWVWIEGNHDPAPPPSLGGRVLHEIQIGRWILRHEPEGEGRVGEICGHFHPCAKIVSKGRSIRARCFATDGRRLVMPAFGAFTGGLNVCDKAFNQVFATPPHAILATRSGAYPVAPHQCVPDAN